MNHYVESSEEDSSSEEVLPTLRIAFNTQSSKRFKPDPYRPLNPVIRTTAPRLKDMASATVAISLWNHVNIFRILMRAADPNSADNVCWHSLKKQVEELSNKLPIPHSVITQIHPYISKVQTEFTNWAKYHFRTVFLYSSMDFIAYNYVGDLIWHSDGTINCVETARNISKSKSPRLSDIEKYFFLCMYCLEEEMQKMTEILSTTFEDYVDFEKHPLIRYWNCYFSNKLHTILIPKDEDDDEELSLDCYMFRHRFVDNWPAKEYFFDRLSPEEQVQNAIWLIDELGVVYQKVLLMKLNESQRISVYLERSVEIIRNYVKTGVNSVDVIMTWSEVRGLITREEFTSLFEELLNGRASGSVLTEVWISIGSDLKNHLLTYNNYKFIEKILYSFEWTKDFNFVIIVFQDLNEDMRAHANKKFLKDFCEKFFSHRESLQWLDRFSNVCFGKASKQFKQDFVLNSTSIKTLCYQYYSSGDLTGFNDMLTYLFTQMPDRIPEYKINLLNSTTGASKCVELLDSNTEALNEIIVDTLSTSDSVIEFRKNLVFSAPAIGKMRDMLVNNDLNKVKKIVDGFLTSDQDKKKLKRILIEGFSNLISDIFRKSDGSYLQSILLWAYGNENRVKELKILIPIDRIFEEMLKEAVPEAVKFHLNTNLCGKHGSKLSNLDRLLIWYFESPSEVKKYKLRRIHSYSNINVITSLLRKRVPSEVERLATVVKWFFEDDQAEIDNFKRIHSKDKIASVF